MEVYLNDLIYGISYALDHVERSIAAISRHHSRRVAYIASVMAREAGFSREQCVYLAEAAALHDNALAECQQLALQRGEKFSQDTIHTSLAQHCTLGERNLSGMVSYPFIQEAVLYHHERADGSGPFGRTAANTPPFAKLIHIADQVDVQFDLSTVSEEKFQLIRAFVQKRSGILFDTESAALFLHSFPEAAQLQLGMPGLDALLREALPDFRTDYSPAEIIRISGIFSKIIDFKSSFTCRHSAGIAEKAMEMGRYYGYDEETCARLYLAGALHDVGKLMVDSQLLEKPDKLTDSEYVHIQNHAYASYTVLAPIRGMEEVAAWAYLHHEKLDGSGYPFGRTGSELNEKERLLACLDIYQALVEPRPYKDGMPHTAAMSILRRLAESNKLDNRITMDIDRCFGEGM